MYSVHSKMHTSRPKCHTQNQFRKPHNICGSTNSSTSEYNLMLQRLTRLVRSASILFLSHFLSVFILIGALFSFRTFPQFIPFFCCNPPEKHNVNVWICKSHFHNECVVVQRHIDTDRLQIYTGIQRIACVTSQINYLLQITVVAWIRPNFKCISNQ